MDVTSPLCAGPDLLHGKRVLGLGMYVQEGLG